MGCSNLGMYMRDGTGGPKDMPKAIELSRKACDDGEGPACERLAEMYDEGNGVMRDQIVARKIYTRACELDAGCNNLGVMYLRGEGGDADAEQAKNFFEKACNRDDATGCLNLARMKRDGTVRGNVNLADAAELFDRACKAGNKEACDELDPTVERTKAKCLKKASDCNNWGYLNEHGYGVQVSMTAAIKLYEKACKAKDSNACYNLGNIYAKGRGGTAVDVKKGLKFYDQACKLNDDDACANAAKLRD
jgi:TPR repeat protein